MTSQVYIQSSKYINRHIEVGKNIYGTQELGGRKLPLYSALEKWGWRADRRGERLLTQCFRRGRGRELSGAASTARKGRKPGQKF